VENATCADCRGTFVGKSGEGRMRMGESSQATSTSCVIKRRMAQKVQ